MADRVACRTCLLRLRLEQPPGLSERCIERLICPVCHRRFSCNSAAWGQGGEKTTHTWLAPYQLSEWRRAEYPVDA